MEQKINEEEKEKNTQDQYKYSICFRLIEYNEANYMDEVIVERQEGINKIENIMRNINEMTLEMGTEVQIQGEKLGRHFQIKLLKRTNGRKYKKLEG